jgi:hypothetical protein
MNQGQPERPAGLHQYAGPGTEVADGEIAAWNRTRATVSSWLARYADQQHRASLHSQRRFADQWRQLLRLRLVPGLSGHGGGAMSTYGWIAHYLRNNQGNGVDDTFTSAVNSML